MLKNNPTKSEDNIDQNLKKLKMRIYKRDYQRQRRKDLPECSVSMTNEERAELKAKAKEHGMPLSIFIREASLGYIRKQYVTPNQEIVNQIAQEINMSYNLITETMEENPGLSHFQELLDRLAQLEKYVVANLEEPRSIEDFLEEVIKKNPPYRIQLLKFLGA